MVESSGIRALLVKEVTTIETYGEVIEHCFPRLGACRI